MAVAGWQPFLLVSSLFLVIHLVHGQGGSFLDGSRDTLVEPFGDVTLTCLFDPNILPHADGLGQMSPSAFFTWKFKKTGQTTEDGIVNYGSGQPWLAQNDVMQLVGDVNAGQFNLRITNVTYDLHDGDYNCEVSIPAYRGVERKVLRSRPFHLYVKYQPQSPQVIYSPSADNLREDQKLVVTCSSQGGNPPPVITWLRDGVPVRAMPGTSIVNTTAKNRKDVTSAALVLEPLSRDHDKAQYTCRVENPSLSQPLQNVLTPLNVHYKPRITVAAYVGSDRVGPFNPLAVEPGMEALMTCSVDANPPVTTPSWLKDGYMFQASSANYTFTPGALTTDSTGNYSCTASNGIGGEQSALLRVDIYYTPKVTVMPAVLGLKEGASGTLHCQVDSRPKADLVEWYNANGDRITASESLTLSDIKRPEAGPYECRARVRFLTSGGVSQVTREGRGTGRVDVQYKPGAAVIEPAQPRTVMGSGISLKCGASDAGLPAAQFRWRKLDGRGVPEFVGSYFNFSETKLDDNGDYECTPFNDVGNGVSKVVRLEITEPVSWTDNNNGDVLVKKLSDKPMSLSCAARGRPAPQFKWLKDGQEILEADGLYSVVNSEPSNIDRLSFIVRSELKFEGSARMVPAFSLNDTLQRTDRGRYTCVARNDAGDTAQPISRDTKVIMQYAPEFVMRYNKVATNFSPSSSGRLECIVEGNPGPSITWSQNGQPLSLFSGRQRIEQTQNSNISEEAYKSVLVLDGPTESDLGEYTCLATNMIGGNSARMTLVRQSVPETPSNLKQKNLDYNAVTLQWESGFDGGFPQRFTVVVGGGNHQEIPVVPSDASEYRVTGLLPLTKYTFRVKSESQLGPSSGTTNTLEIVTLKKPIFAEDIPRPSALIYSGQTGLVSFASRDASKVGILCAMIELRRANDNTYTPVAKCLPFKNNEGAFKVPNPGQEDYHPRLRFCLYDTPNVCGEPVDEQTVLLQASTLSGARLDIILPIVIILAIVFFGCLVTCVVCRRRARRTPVKTAKASNLTLTTHGSLENSATGGFYGSEYVNQTVQDNGSQGGIYATHGSKIPQYPGMMTHESPYANGGLYSQVDRKLNGDLSQGGHSPYKSQIVDMNGGSNLYSSGNMYLQPYPTYDDGYGHQHSPLEPNYTHLPVEVNGLPDPYEEYEKTPSFGEESVESGYSTSNSRGRRVIREIIV